MKNILSKIYIHPIFIIVVFIFMLIGRFKLISYFMLLITVHELGHIITSFIFNWKIKKIIILPFGGLTKYETPINTPIIEELLVGISGILFQIIFYLLFKNNISYKYFSYINYFIIIFNLIPIYPLDGSKIINALLNYIISFKKCLKLNIIISYIFIIICMILSFKVNKLFIIVFIFLLIEVYRNSQNINIIFNKFLLERYIKKYKFNKEIKINNINNMRKDFRHLIKKDGKYETEYTFLHKMFDNKHNL